MSEREEYYAGYDAGRETEIEEAEVDAYDEEYEREQIREINERNTLDLQAKRWRNLWWSIGLLALLWLAFVVEKWRAIWQ